MRFRLSIGNGSAALASMALTVLCLANAQAGPGDKIQFSAPTDPATSSNLNRLNPRESTFKQVQDDLFKPFKLGNQHYNEDGVMSVPPPSQMAPVVTDKRTLDLIEKRKNWAFANWNDLFPETSLDELANGEADGKEKKPVSLIERYYESLNQKPSSATNRASAKERMMQSLAGTNSFDLSGEAFTPEGQFNKIMRKILNPAGADREDRSVVDFQHTALRPPSPGELQEQKRRFEEFQRLLDPHLGAAPVSPVNSGFQAQTGNAAGNLLDAAPARRGPLNPSMAVADPTARSFYSHAYDDPTALALGQTNNLLTPRPVVPPQPAASLHPFDDLPKRKF